MQGCGKVTSYFFHTFSKRPQRGCRGNFGYFFLESARGARRENPGGSLSILYRESTKMYCILKQNRRAKRAEESFPYFYKKVIHDESEGHLLALQSGIQWDNGMPSLGRTGPGPGPAKMWNVWICGICENPTLPGPDIFPRTHHQCPGRHGHAVFAIRSEL